MSFEELVNSGIFATILTALVTAGTCVFSEVYGYRKLKTEKFGEIYKCLDEFIEKRTEIVGKCNQMSQQLADVLPDKWDMKNKKKYNEMYIIIYQKTNEIIAEYSKFLDLFISFSCYLFKNKAIKPVIKADCWSFLNLYEQVIGIQKNLSEPYKMKYAQIASLVETIRLSGKWKDRKKLCEYLERNHVSEYE